MMTIKGRLTGNAAVKTLDDNRQVTEFTIAMNDTYKNKQGEKVKVAAFVDCSYWLSSKVAEWLTKGTLVELYGRIGVDAYTNKEGKAIARLKFHVNNIEPLAKGNSAPSDNGNTVKQTKGQAVPEETEDLPF